MFRNITMFGVRIPMPGSVGELKIISLVKVTKFFIPFKKCHMSEPLLPGLNNLECAKSSIHVGLNCEGFESRESRDFPQQLIK